MLAIAHIKLPAMPGAGDNAALQFPFAQWAPLVRADAVQSEVLPLNVEERDDSIRRHHLKAAARRASAAIGN